MSEPNAASSADDSQAQQTSAAASALRSPTMHVLPSNQQAVQTGAPGHNILPQHHSGPDVSYPLAMGQEAAGVGAAGPSPGPLRHPRPLTAAELHSQLEQEQEFIVNRLSRDLTMLRMTQNASVVSNASSTSASTSAVDQMHPSSFTDTHMMSGPGYPVMTNRRHHRTSSSTSTRSLSQIASQGSSTAPISIPLSHSGSAASVLEAARNPRGAAGMSRQNSTASRRTSSRNRSPQPYPGSVPSHSLVHPFPDAGGLYYGRNPANASVVATPGSEYSPGLISGTLRYEEATVYRNELELVRRENEALKKRVRDLEKMLKERRESDTSGTGVGRLRSESGSTMASVSISGANNTSQGSRGIAGARKEERRLERTGTGLAVGVPDEELKVGESAATTARSSEAESPTQAKK